MTISSGQKIWTCLCNSASQKFLGKLFEEAEFTVWEKSLIGYFVLRRQNFSIKLPSEVYLKQQKRRIKRLLRDIRITPIPPI